MRLRILQNTYTVGEFLEAGKMVEVDEPLAKSLIAQGKAAEAFPGMTQATEKLVSPPVLDGQKWASPVQPTPITIPEATPMTAGEAVKMEVVEPAPKPKPSKKPAAKKYKPAAKKYNR